MQTPAGQGVGAKLVAQCAVEGPEHTTSPQAMNAREITKAPGGSWHGSYGLCQCPAHDDGCTRFYEEVKRGEIKLIKIGKRTLVPDSEAQAWQERKARASK